MTTDQPNSSPAKVSGRGVDLFFGEDAAPEAAVNAAAAVQDEAAAVNAAAAAQGEAVAVNAAAAAQGEAAAVNAAAAAQGEAAAADSGGEGAAAPAIVAVPAPERSATPPSPSSSPPSQPVLVEGTTAKSSNGCLAGVLGATFGAMLGVLLTLGFLLVANQGLSYAPRSSMVALQATVTAYESRAGDLGNNVGALQQGLAGVQSELTTQGESHSALAGEVTGVVSQVQDLQVRAEALPVLQADVAGLQGSVATVSDTVGLVAGDVATLTQRVDVVSVSAERGQRFLDGMQALLASVLDDEAPAASAPLTATLPATATRQVTATLPLTATTPITATAPLTATPPVTTTPAITSTAPLTPGVQAPLTTTVPLTTSVAPTATVAPAATPAVDAIRGVVFLDANRDGVRAAAGEPGIANVRVTLYTQNRTEVARTTTDLQGEYEFSGLTPGIYIVVQTDAPGFASSTPNVLTAILRSNRATENVNFGDYRR